MNLPHKRLKIILTLSALCSCSQVTVCCHAILLTMRCNFNISNHESHVTLNSTKKGSEKVHILALDRNANARGLSTESGTSRESKTRDTMK